MKRVFGVNANELSLPIPLVFSNSSVSGKPIYKRIGRNRTGGTYGCALVNPTAERCVQLALLLVQHVAEPVRTAQANWRVGVFLRSAL